MKNIELKNLYWKSNESKRIEIKNILKSKSTHKRRVLQGNVDLLIHSVEPISPDDEKVYVMVNGIFTEGELNI